MRLTPRQSKESPGYLNWNKSKDWAPCFFQQGYYIYGIWRINKILCACERKNSVGKVFLHALIHLSTPRFPYTVDTF